MSRLSFTISSATSLGLSAGDVLLGGALVHGAAALAPGRWRHTAFVYRDLPDMGGTASFPGDELDRPMKAGSCTQSLSFSGPMFGARLHG
jgi:hypothetical protein